MGWLGQSWTLRPVTIRRAAACHSAYLEGSITTQRRVSGPGGYAPASMARTICSMSGVFGPSALRRATNIMRSVAV
jgi:hypothetical protein